MNTLKQFAKQSIKNYGFSLALLLSIVLGSLFGWWMGPEAAILKPLGEIFLNLMFVVVTPLVFFSISSSVGSVKEFQRFGRIMVSMISVFLLMGIIGATYMLVVTYFFPPGHGFHLTTTLHSETMDVVSTDHSFLNLLTVSDFPKLFARENMLALIIFALLVGAAVSVSGEKGKPFHTFLESGMAVFMKLTSFIMYYAPIGFFAYFSVLIGQLGHEIMSAYYYVAMVYCVSALFYFIVVFTFYAWLAKEDLKSFWKNLLPPSITALATCSSAASIPVNLNAAEKMGVPPEIYQTVIPLGTIIHKQGSILAGVIKIAFLFSLYHLPFAGPHTFLMAIGVALLVGIVMGAIPGGGMLGEMLIISIYGFPPEALMIIAVIPMLIDPPATLLNVTGNTVSCLLIRLLSKEKK